MKIKIRKLIDDLTYLILNYFVCNIPCWHIRLVFYKLFGMKIGKGARIHMKCKVLAPQKIIIGERSIINEFCFLDGRGGLNIGPDTSISIYSCLLTGTHDIHSPKMQYQAYPITIGRDVWICARTIIISPSNIEDFAVIGAGSVFRGNAIKNGVYVGNPASLKKERGLTEYYNNKYKPYFR